MTTRTPVGHCLRCVSASSASCGGNLTDHRRIFACGRTEAIAAGKLWASEIKNAVNQSVFFIPIITPTVAKSPYCKFELDSFLAREKELGRADLVFPIIYIGVAALEDSEESEKDPVLSIIAKRQWVDWK
jgi:hypothetical protein